MQTFVLILVYPGDFIYNENESRCLRIDSNILKEFTFSTTLTPNSSIARYQCEHYCSTRLECWGCENYCDQTCKWSAINKCEQERNVSVGKETNISQKPGNTRYNKLQFSYKCSKYILHNVIWSINKPFSLS